MNLDQRAFSEAVQRERELHLSFNITFDPAKHKRGVHGKFTKQIGSLAPGQKITLPDGIAVHKQQRGYTVVHGSKTYSHGGAGGAATRALDASARGTHPRSIGGADSYHSFSEFKDAESRDKAQARRLGRKPKRGDKGDQPAVGDMFQALRSMRVAGATGSLSQPVDGEALKLALERARKD